MVESIFWGSTILFVFFTFYKIICKDYFNVCTYILLGVSLPLSLYLLDLSGLIDTVRSDAFYLIFIYLYIFAIIFNIKTKTLIIQTDIRLRSRRVKVEYFLLIYYVVFFIENIILSDTLFPALNGIDVHWGQVPILLYFSRSGYALQAVCIIYWIYTKKNRYLVYIIVLFLSPIAFRDARMMSIQTFIQIISLFIFLFLFNNKTKRIGKLTTIFKIKLISMFLVVALLCVLSGNLRINHRGKYDVSYGEGIDFRGANIEMLAWYYGYFPLSFNNLNMSIKKSKIEPNYLGLYSFNSFYFGILQIDNILGIKNNVPQNKNYYIIPAANVPTGFWDFYYDYKNFVFIPIFVFLWLCSYIRNQILKTKGKLEWCVVYFYITPLWFLMSFTNTLSPPEGIICMAFSYFLIKYYFKSERIDNGTISNSNTCL